MLVLDWKLLVDIRLVGCENSPLCDTGWWCIPGGGGISLRREGVGSWSEGNMLGAPPLENGIEGLNWFISVKVNCEKLNRNEIEANICKFLFQLVDKYK